MFLAQVGLSSGPKFSATVAETGFLFLGMGAAILATLVLCSWANTRSGCLRPDGGDRSGSMRQNKIGPTDRPDIAYAMIFPGITILKILFVDIVAGLFIG